VLQAKSIKYAIVNCKLCMLSIQKCIFRYKQMLFNEILVNADVDFLTLGSRSCRRQGSGVSLRTVAQVSLNAGAAIIAGVEVDTGFTDRK
jgi:hypothetical protein